MKLQILVPRHNESEEIMKNLFDSIAFQRMIDEDDDFEVLVCDDCSDKLPLDKMISFFSSYKFPIRLIKNKENKGISYTRNRLMDEATADYIMWCDADDMFCSSVALKIIFDNIRTYKFDIFSSSFFEENKIFNENMRKTLILIENDCTFVHGKVYRREFFKEVNLRWPEDIKINEDTYFNRMAQKLCSRDKIIEYKIPIYLWAQREHSVTRDDPETDIKSWPDLIKATELLIDESITRGLGEQEAAVEMVLLVVLAFFDFAYYRDQKRNKELIKTTERLFVDWFRKYQVYWDYISKEDKKDIISLMQNKGNALMIDNRAGIKFKEGNLFKLEGWLNWLLIKYPTKK